jgi:plastocyanin
MRLHLLLGLAASITLATAACSSDDTTADGGTSGSGGTSGTAGSSGDSGASGDTGTSGTSGTSGSGGTSGTGGTSGDSGTDSASDAAADSGANVRCTTFDDKTSLTTVPVTWNLQVESTGSSNCCVKVKVGTKLSLAGNFAASGGHPVGPNGGTTPNPFTGLTMPTTGNLDVTLSAAGTFGYLCTNHPASMRCAVQVVP